MQIRSSSNNWGLRRNAFEFGKHLLLGIYAVVVFYPLLLMVFSSLKSAQDIMTNPLGFPDALSLDNYRVAWIEASFADYVVNSVVVTGAATLLLVLLASMVAFVLARFQFRGNNLITLLFLAGLVLPMRMGLVPLFILMRDLGLMNTRIGLVVVYIAGGLPFSIFLLQNYFQSIPNDIEDAAKLDGCGPLRLYWNVMIPLVRPGLATVSIYQLVGIWNDFFFPLLFIRKPELRTIPLGVARFFGEYETEWGLLFSGLTMATVPVIAAFLLFSKQFIKGLTSGSIK